MKRLVVVLVLLLAGSGQLGASDVELGGMKLLPGYHIRKNWELDALSATIEKTGGLIIHFEAGKAEGYAVDQKVKDNYAWYREQSINGHKVLVALIRPGVKTDSDLDKERNLPPGNVLLVTYPLGGDKAHAANFVGKVADSEEMIDMLLMVVTFDPSKGNF